MTHTAPPSPCSGAPCGAHPLAGRLAAPSCVLPAPVADNAAFLAGKVDEVGLCFFETRSCLEYTQRDLPREHALLPLRWHVHLPVDLPWPARAAKAASPARGAASLALAVMDKAAHLRPHLAVLHPPQGNVAGQRALLADFQEHWRTHTSVPLLLENVGHCDVACLGENFLREHGLGLCLDVGHLLGYGQENLLASPLVEDAALAHWSAPGARDQHLPLTELTPVQRQTAAAVMRRLPATAVHLLEIFQQEGLFASLPVLAALARPDTPPR